MATCAAVSGNTVYVGGWGAAGASLGDATVTKFDLDGALFWRRSVVSTSGSEGEPQQNKGDAPMCLIYSSLV